MTRLTELAETERSTMTFIEKLTVYKKAAYPALWVTTFEETRLTNEVRFAFHRSATGGKPMVPVYQWDCVNGLVLIDGNNIIRQGGLADPKRLFPSIVDICKKQDDAIFIIKDFHLQLEKPLNKAELIAAIKTVAPEIQANRGLLLFCSAVTKIPTELSKEIQLVDYKLPDEEAIGKALEEIISDCNANRADKPPLIISPDLKLDAVEAAKGMTSAEVSNAFALAIVENKEVSRGFVKSVFNEKVAQVKMGGLLTYIESGLDFGDVGGLINIKRWVTARKNAFTDRAKQYMLPFPKGMLLAGIPGCGKTLISRAIAAEFGFPLFQLDLGSLFSKWVGETEQNFINMIKTIDSLGRCVILIDEIEKYLNTGAVSGSNDSGVGSRSFGTLASWLNDRTNPAFIIATSNNHLILPPELVRKGRFDELFWLDLPNLEERAEIFNVVIKKFGRNPEDFDIPRLAEMSDTFTGAEISNMFKDAMFAAFSSNEEVDSDHVSDEIEVAIPQAETNVCQITEMRNKVRGKLRTAADYRNVEVLYSPPKRGIQTN